MPDQPDLDMPQPMRPPSQDGAVGPGVTSGPNVILERPELAAQIGNVIANWTLIEQDLLSIYGLVMGQYLTVPKEVFDFLGNVSPPFHPVARQIFDEVNALNARLRLVSALCKWLTTPEELAEFEVLSGEISRVSRRRNDVAHEGWGICDAYPDALILMRLQGGMMIYKKRDFEEISEAIISAHTKLGQLQYKLHQRLSEKLNSR